MPTFGSLFAGIGGIDLGLERAGWTGRWQVEWDPYCQHVLAHHWPDVPRYGDITRVDWSTVEPVDLIAGGFPCQPVSSAGLQRAQDDDRWLWPEFARAIGELRPRLVLVENVPNLLAVNGGSAFAEVLGDLAALGYDAEWDCIPAAALGAPHQRDRVWIVAHAQSFAERVAYDQVNALPDGGTTWPLPLGRGSRAPETLADTLGERGRGGDGQRPYATDVDSSGEGVGPGGHGDWWAVEPDVGRVAYGVPARVDRLRALGNAVVPQVVEVIGRRLMEDARNA